MCYTCIMRYNVKKWNNFRTFYYENLDKVSAFQLYFDLIEEYPDYNVTVYDEKYKKIVEKMVEGDWE